MADPHSYHLICWSRWPSAGRATRDQIMRRCADASWAFDRSIDVHMGRIRAAIEAG